MKTLIIIPTYNEVGNLRPLLDEIFERVPETDILIVDDNSPDGTGKLAEEMPKIQRARAAQDEKEERWIRKLAASRHGPAEADWILHARMVAPPCSRSLSQAVCNCPGPLGTCQRS